jgi:hypothetical protein
MHFRALQHKAAHPLGKHHPVDAGELLMGLRNCIVAGSSITEAAVGSSALLGCQLLLLCLACQPLCGLGCHSLRSLQSGQDLASALAIMN